MKAIAILSFIIPLFGLTSQISSAAPAKKTLPAAPAPMAPDSSAPTAPAAVGEEAKLWAELTTYYVKKGMPIADANRSVSEMQKGLSQMPGPARINVLRDMVKRVQAN